MATRVVEGKKPYTGGKAISIDENKVISLNLRDGNNLIIYDEGDDEIYVDLQLDDEITPTSAFPIGVNVGRVIVDNGWDKAGTIISAETTSGDNIKIFYADEGTLWIDNGTGTFKQIYFKADVDALLLALRNYIDGELAKKQNGVSSDTAPSNPSEGDLWYDTTNSAMKVWDGTAWQSVGTGGGGSDIVYATQAEYNALLPGAASDGKHYFIYTSSTPTPQPGWTVDSNTISYLKLDGNLDDETENYTYTSGANFAWDTTVIAGKSIAHATYDNGFISSTTNGPSLDLSKAYTVSCWAKCSSSAGVLVPFTFWNAPTWVTQLGMGIYRFYDGGTIKGYFVYYNGTSPVLLEELFNGGTIEDWHLYTAVYKSGGSKMYVDGVVVKTSSTTWGTATINPGTTIEVGTGAVGTVNRPADGYYSEMLFYEGEKTAQEISDYFDLTKATYGIN